MGWRVSVREWSCSEPPGPLAAAQLGAVLYSPPGGATRKPDTPKEQAGKPWQNFRASHPFSLEWTLG